MAVLFGDTNVVGDVYFLSNYFHWQGECREALLAEYYPEFMDDLRRGFRMAAERGADGLRQDTLAVAQSP